MMWRNLLLLAGLVMWVNASGENLVKNGNFEDGLKSWLVPGWLKDTVQPELEKADEPGPGMGALRLSGEKGKKCIVYQVLRFPKNVTRYQVSLKAKTDNMASWANVIFYISVKGIKKPVWSGNIQTGKNTKVSTPWTEYKGTFELPAEVMKQARYGHFYLQISTNYTGTARFDDVAVEPLDLATK